jgi:hypothetical protein
MVTRGSAMRKLLPAILVFSLFVAACGGGSGSSGLSQGGDNPAEAGPTPTATAAPDATDPTPTDPTDTPAPQATDGVPGSATPSAKTPTATPEGPATGPRITYFGVTRADDAPIPVSSSDGLGRPVYDRPLGHGLSLVVEATLGEDRSPIDVDAYDPAGGPPGLEMIVSRPLGDGSAAVCDKSEPLIGGVPATVPFDFAASSFDALNDLGCRVNDGTGRPIARVAADQACTRIGVGRDFAFVDPSSRVQFCLPIAGAWEFADGDTIVAARVRNLFGAFGDADEIVVHVGVPAGTTATRTATATPTEPGPSRTPPPTATPLPPELGPQVTYFGLASADDTPLDPDETDSENRPVFIRRAGQGVSLVVEGRRGTSRRPLRLDGFDEVGGLPGLQLIVSEPLGNGSEAVCDKREPLIGGVPATVPFDFSNAAATVDAINDLGCRVNDGAGQPIARASSIDACTRIGVGRDFDFVSVFSEAQFCLPIARAWSFAPGDTVVAARLQDITGTVGLEREIVVRVVEQ